MRLITSAKPIFNPTGNSAAITSYKPGIAPVPAPFCDTSGAGGVGEGGQGMVMGRSNQVIILHHNRYHACNSWQHLFDLLELLNVDYGFGTAILLNLILLLPKENSLFSGGKSTIFLRARSAFLENFGRLVVQRDAIFRSDLAPQRKPRALCQRNSTELKRFQGSSNVKVTA